MEHYSLEFKNGSEKKSKNGVGIMNKDGRFIA